MTAVESRTFQTDDDLPALGTEPGRIVEEILDDLADTIGRAPDGRGHAALEAEADAPVLADVEAVDDLGEQLVERDVLLRLLIEPRIDRGDVAHAGQQALDARDVPLDDVAEAAALRRIVDLGRHLGGGADGGQRIPKLVRHVGGERLERPDAPFEPPRQLLERAGEVSDLVGAAGALEASGESAAVVEDGLRLVAEASQGTGDGGGHDERKKRRDGDGEEDHFEKAEALGVDILKDTECRLGDENGAGDLSIAAEGDGAVERDGSLSRCGDSSRRAVLAFEGGLDLGAVEAAGGAVELGRLESRRGRLEDAGIDPVEPGAHAVEQLFARGFLAGRIFVGGGRVVGSRSDAARVGEQVAPGVDHAEARFEAPLEGCDEALRIVRVGLRERYRRQRRGEQSRLLDHAALLRAQETMLHDIEVEEAEERQEDEEEVEREQAGPDAGEDPHAPSSPASRYRYPRPWTVWIASKPGLRSRNFRRSRLMWLSIVRSLTYASSA